MLKDLNKEKYIETEYGKKKAGKSRFVVIAPHSAGDDLKTGYIARLLAMELDASVVVNNKYFKSTNSKAGRKPDYIEDFNKLSWSGTNDKYMWKSKKPAMKQFFDDIIELCELAREKSGKEKAVAIYIHGMAHEKLALDLGIGLRAKNGNNRFIGSSKSEYYCSGVPTIRISDLKKLRMLLQDPLQRKYGLSVGVGFEYPAWGKRIAVQFHKHEDRDDYAIQLEINNILKKNDKDIKYLVGLFKKSLRKIFN
ncbi:hypothetical protein KKC32_02345 [Patescibacteria group bacterium]|nr:hypothetical protein [Patescibacteria group bacterium]